MKQSFRFFKILQRPSYNATLAVTSCLLYLTWQIWYREKPNSQILSQAGCSSPHFLAYLKKESIQPQNYIYIAPKHRIQSKTKLSSMCTCWIFMYLSNTHKTIQQKSATHITDPTSTSFLWFRDKLDQPKRYIYMRPVLRFVLCSK